MSSVRSKPKNKTVTQTKAKDVKADPSKSKETHTKSNKRNQDQLTPPHVAKSVLTALNKQTEQAKDKTATQTVAKDVKALPHQGLRKYTQNPIRKLKSR